MAEKHWPIREPRKGKRFDGTEYEYKTSVYLDDDPDVEMVHSIGDGGGYDYSITALFKIDGKLYLGHTSGCSCTAPWEEVSCPDDMLYLSTLDWKAKDESRKRAWAYLSSQCHSLDERFDMIRVIEKALKG